ncbi:MAG: glycoside hydrolase family 25 protein, partial [Planctomycetales bacterium]|nr:glycoside hydrolase family 25 protein [Planctomycetales bacterium]
MKPYRIVVFTALLVFAGGLPCVAQPFLSGIDVSRWQGSINWNSVRSAGVEFAFTKATEGVNYVDPRFHQNMQGAADAGVLIGPYHFCRVESYNGAAFTTYNGGAFTPGSAPYLDAVSEANDFLAAILPYYATGSYLPPVADVERLPDFATYSLERAFISNWVQLFSDTIYDALGTRPIVYTSKSAANTYYTPAVAAQHELWEAWWKGTGTSNPPQPSDTPSWGDWLFWQWTDSWSVPGVSGNVDGDVFEGSRADLESLLITRRAQPDHPFANVNVLADFEAGEGLFQWSATYSGSTTGVLAGSDAFVSSDLAYDGAASQKIVINGSDEGWFLRHLSGVASPPASATTNEPLASRGSLGVWLRTETEGVSVALAIDDSDSTERSETQALVADGRWRLYEWDLDDDDDWQPWVAGSNGALDGATVTFDSLQLFGAGYAIVYFDRLAHN